MLNEALFCETASQNVMFNASDVCFPDFQSWEDYSFMYGYHTLWMKSSIVYVVIWPREVKEKFEQQMFILLKTITCHDKYI